MALDFSQGWDSNLQFTDPDTEVSMSPGCVATFSPPLRPLAVVWLCQGPTEPPPPEHFLNFLTSSGGWFMMAELGSGAARWRRELQPRSFLKHERMTVRMSLAEALFGSMLPTVGRPVAPWPSAGVLSSGVRQRSRQSAAKALHHSCVRNGR